MPLSDSHHDPVRRKDCRYRTFAPRSPPTAKSAGREGSLFWREGFGEWHRLTNGQGRFTRRTDRCLQIPMCGMTEEAKVRFDRQPDREVRIAPPATIREHSAGTVAMCLATISQVNPRSWVDDAALGIYSPILAHRVQPRFGFRSSDYVGEPGWQTANSAFADEQKTALCTPSCGLCPIKRALRRVGRVRGFRTGSRLSFPIHLVCAQQP